VSNLFQGLGGKRRRKASCCNGRRPQPTTVEADNDDEGGGGVGGGAAAAYADPHVQGCPHSFMRSIILKAAAYRAAATLALGIDTVLLPPTFLLNPYIPHLQGCAGGYCYGPGLTACDAAAPGGLRAPHLNGGLACAAAAAGFSW